MPLLGAQNQATLTAFLRRVAGTLPRPKAILMATAHWESHRVMVSTSTQPPMLYDYYGFPPEAYQLSYPAPGSPEVAARVLELLREGGIPAEADAKRGFDHGTFVPLMLAFPDADIPVVQMSLHESLDPRAHLAVGRALAPLRDEGVLIVGSGMSFHNMGAFRKAGFGMNGPVPPLKASQDFDRWLQEAVTQASGDARGQLLEKWASAPGARESHPREEHLIPLMVAAGAAGDSAGHANFSDAIMGATISGFVFA